MAKTRVYELAKQLRLTNKDLMDLMSQLGIFTRSHMSVLENGEVIKIRNYFRKQRRDRAAQIKQEQEKIEAVATVPETAIEQADTQTVVEPIKEEETREITVKETRPAAKKETVGKETAESIPPDEEQPHLQVVQRDKQAIVPEPARPAVQERSVPERTDKQQPHIEEQKQAFQLQHQNMQSEGRQRRDDFRAGDRQGAPAKAATGTRPAGRGTGRQADRKLHIPAPPPEVVSKDIPDKRRERPGKYSTRQAEEVRSRKKEMERQRQERVMQRGRSKDKTAAKQEPPKVVRKITLTGSITVQELAKRIGKTAAQVIKYLMNQGIMATINQELDVDTAAILAQDMGAVVEIKLEKPITELEDLEDSPETLQERPPVVTVMGHVDHGKTSLLDAIRRTDVTASEAGGITQHIGAYQVKIKDRKITFLDTPGHEAFTAMRARGAQATDIAILVVAADDGVMPQTVEAINHAKAADVPVVVAINKMDRPEANPDRVKQQLTEYGLVAEEWGGDTIMVPVSALKREGLNELLEMVLLTADIRELKANPNRMARGIVIEAQLDKGRGPVATMLVQKGSLKVGDNLIAGSVYGRVRAMFNDKSERVNSAGPSMPVEVLGLSELPQAGDIFQVVEEEKFARQVSMLRQTERRQEELKSAGKTSLEDLFKQMEGGDTKDLNLVVKGDVQGSVEALRSALEQLSTSEVKVNIIHGGVGAITETDVMLAAASKAIIVGFNVRPDANTRKAAEEAGVEIRLYRVIYEAIDEIKAAMTGLLEPEKREVVLGRAEVRATFKVPKAGTVAGCYVSDGKITNKALVRVIRDGVVVFEGRIDSLKRFKDDVREVAQGYECGIGLEKYNDIKEGDVVEAYTIEEVKREL